MEQNWSLSSGAAEGVVLEVVNWISCLRWIEHLQGRLGGQ